MEDRNYGTIRIKLDEMIEKQNISKNKLAHRAEMQRTQLNQFCKGTVTRLDTAVLICWSMFRQKMRKNNYRSMLIAGMFSYKYIPAI